MSKVIEISDQMAKIISFIAQEAGTTEELAVKRIFAVIKAIYVNTDDKDITIKDSTNTVTIKGIR